MNPEISEASEIYTEDSVLIGKYFNENRSPVKFGFPRYPRRHEGYGKRQRTWGFDHYTATGQEHVPHPHPILHRIARENTWNKNSHYEKQRVD